ncbi:MAG: hypothetical protein M3065_09895, partial [Actinomycetota bacterium]|nr:hypothetical protein [Actinomycetota bacterium]
IRWVGLDVNAHESTIAIFDQDTGELTMRRVVGRRIGVYASAMPSHISEVQSEILHEQRWLGCRQDAIDGAKGSDAPVCQASQQTGRGRRGRFR